MRQAIQSIHSLSAVITLCNLYNSMDASIDAICTVAPHAGLASLLSGVDISLTQRGCAAGEKKTSRRRL